MNEFAHFFTEVTGYDKVHQWQVELARPHDCNNRLIRIPTGFGKTLGVLATWIWHRVHKQNTNWPCRLIWCLPMRVLVEQTESEVREALERLGMLWKEDSTPDGKVGVHLLLGGADSGQWHIEGFGPFTLAWLEALLRAADQRASKQTITEELLQQEENNDAGQPLERDHQALAHATGGGTSAPSLRSDPPTCRQLHGDGGRTSGRGMDSGTTRPPHSATRYVETSVGILSYRDLAPLLAERVAETELAISKRPRHRLGAFPSFHPFSAKWASTSDSERIRRSY